MPPTIISPWAFPIGALMALLLTMGLLYWQGWRRRQRRERPPIQSSLLRPPGHSLSIRLLEKGDALFTPIAVMAVCAAGLVAGWAALIPILLSRPFGIWLTEHGGWIVFFHTPLLPVTLTCVSGTIGFLAGVSYGLLRTSQLFKEIHSLRLGLRGEQAVGEKLQELAAEGFRSFHDLPAGKNWNIDHVVVGPPGVFAIETKTRSKRKAPPGRKDQEVVYDGKVLRFPWFTNHKAREQAAANASWLGNYLRQSTGIESLRVTGMLVIPGWFVSPQSDPRNYAVPALPESLLGKHLRRLPRTLTDQQIQQIAFQVEQKCRDVEF